MRPAGRHALESLYFDYPTFAPPSLGAVAAAGETQDVVIVGAGPIGMAAALTLARYGVRSVLIDEKTTFNDGSRAICVSRSSMYALERMGAVAPFLEKALGWTRGKGFFRGREIGAFEMPHAADDKYLPMYNLQQQYIEQFLHRAVADSGLVDERWGTRLTGLTPGKDGVDLRLTSAEGDYGLSARWVLAADGARSAIRAALGLRLKGTNLEGRYVIADIQADLGFPTERRVLFEPRSNPGGTVLLHRQPENIWRVDYQLAPGEDANAAIEEDNIRARVGAILAEVGFDGGWDLEWWSVYTANTLCLDDYRHGRVFFIGDSAHIVPIFGVRGLNNGLQDAENIGWKLARVLKGASPEGILDSYSPERRSATLDVFANASRSAAFMTPPTPGHMLMRRAALSLSISEAFPRSIANPRQMTPHVYDPGPLIAPDAPGFAAGPRPGAFCPDVRLADGGFLLDRLGKGYTGFLFSPDAARAERIASAGVAVDPDFRLARVGADAAANVPDPEGRVAAAFGAEEGTLYLLRPDQYVAARVMDATERTLQDLLR